jgi:hypothetical protein
MASGPTAFSASPERSVSRVATASQNGGSHMCRCSFPGYPASKLLAWRSSWRLCRTQAPPVWCAL